MNYLLDTNVVSEWTKAQPSPSVANFLAATDEETIYLSVITFAELRYGIARLPAGARRKRLDQWLSQELTQRFERRVLPIDARVADAWGITVAKRDSAGRPIGALDALIAATADVHELTLVTRNTSDFEGTVASLLNPWR